MPEDRNDDGFIDLDAEDLDDTPDESGTIEITKEDLDDIPEPAPISGREYPDVDPKDLAAQKDAGLIEMTAMCSSTGEPFTVMWEQVEPGVFEVARVERAGPAAKEKARNETVAVEGHFSLERFPGCPYCGAMRMSVCEECGVTICEGGITTNLLGQATLKCPACGNRGLVEGEAGRIWGAGGKGKGKAGPGKK